MTAETRMAIDVFRKLLTAERKVERYQNQLNEWVARIPTEEIEEYRRITQAMENK